MTTVGQTTNSLFNNKMLAAYCWLVHTLIELLTPPPLALAEQKTNLLLCGELWLWGDTVDVDVGW